jgi:hypothetical protein
MGIQEYGELLPHSAKSYHGSVQHKLVNQRIMKSGTLDIQHGTEIHETDNILLQIREMLA